MITLLSYNIEYGRKINEIYDWIKNLEETPNIICFQEFPETELLKLEKVKFYNKQEFCFAPGLVNDANVFGELTLFNNSKLILKKDKYIDFGKDNFESLYKRLVIKRSALISEFEINNKLISVSNLHLTPLSLHDKRKKQLSKVIENISLERSLIVGDFNYSSIFGRNGLVNFMDKYDYKIAGDKMTTNVYKTKIPQQLDYVFYKKIIAKDIKVLPVSYSDHYPVIFTFDL